MFNDDNEVNLKQVENKFGNIENIQILHDDMIIMGKDREEHDRTVEQVLKRAKEIKLLKYSLNVYYVPGKDIHFADMLSRSTLKIETSDPEMLEMVHSVSKHLPMSIEKQTELRLATSNDSTLRKMFDYYFNGWSKKKHIPDECKPFYKMKDAIYVEAGIVFYEDKIIVPKSMQKQIIETLHNKGHLGTRRTINKARKLFYWINMTTDITNYIKQCRVCEKYMPRNRKEPMMPHTIPKLRFNKVACDSLEYGSKPYLVTVDYFSHWMDLVPLQDKTSRAVIDAFQNLFTKFGYPQFLITDNLPFISQRCLNYYREKDITVSTCTPEWHQSNGLAEKAVYTAKQILRKATEEKVDFRDFLFEYNNSEITSLKSSPAEILQSRTLRDQLPTSSSSLEPRIQNHIFETLGQQQKKVKANYDKRAHKKPATFQKGDRVVIKTSKDPIWHKAIVIEKATEPKSYWGHHTRAVVSIVAERTNDIVQIKSTLFAAPDGAPSPYSLDSAEIFERVKRSYNILLRNVSESDTEESECIDKSIKKERRNPPHLRLLMVSFWNNGVVETLLRNKKKLLNSGDFRSVLVSVDKTPQQLSARSQLQLKVKDRETS
ncbi:uncharacterized protein K02A2.6-like [Coccinella septempunctata]|uniref:uncharacterized protein K02A2.6-like n=1 Tax=Coccinella septempunctata TaxID=41139 RepID=UPI001D07986F|nr:uncharacterized protein K02A2.6-like [Coccinella septempunctata]